MKAAMMMMVAAGLFLAATAHAAQQFGVEVYPGAKPDAKVAKSVEKMGVKNVHAYRTSDPVGKVAEFYRKQKLKEMPGTSAQGAGFSGPNGVNVTVQNPWMDMDSGAMMKDTLISIVKQ